MMILAGSRKIEATGIPFGNRCLRGEAFLASAKVADFEDVMLLLSGAKKKLTALNVCMKLKALREWLINDGSGTHILHKDSAHITAGELRIYSKTKNYPYSYWAWLE